MSKIIITGAGTDVGKTIICAIVLTILQGDYWKPIQSGTDLDSDTETVKNLVDRNKHYFHTPAYSFKAALSPHHAAQLEGVIIDPTTVKPPSTTRPLVIETAGGVLVPLTKQITCLDLFQEWNARWIVVSRHYLGSINHTLLTIEMLKQRKQSIVGLIFNGSSNINSEEAILQISQLPLLGQIFHEPNLNHNTIQRYAKQWHHSLIQNL